ncbi:bleomycin hydrolase [Drosophila sulfurigaster albostrigata]|uniref:bleomycin hydrolase n=1 Tax=Drosophila sulfurigaster albostrigata TaxID=89887 RepID=UPI002D21D447|nr:bleomycin hydrolase [Drosophila sulfurigaster albostrigata]
MAKLSLHTEIESEPISEYNHKFALSRVQLDRWRSQFYATPLNRLAQNICTTSDPIRACLRQDLTTLAMPGKIQHKLEKVIKPTADGPNWLCAGLDLLRLAMKKDCELSVPYLFYWHKLERCNYVLNSVVELLERCEPLDGRTFQYLMKHLVPDGGNWQMFVNLVQKYGIMPHKCYFVSWSASRSLHLNKMLRSKLHEFSSRLHAQFTFDGDGSNLPSMVKTMVEELYKIISICLGTPPLEFSWTFKNEKKGKTYTPMSFYQRFVTPFLTLNAQICLGHDPRLSSGYQKNYRIAYACNMVDGVQQSYNNQPVEKLLEIMVASLAAGSAVWLVCDLQAIFNTKSEVLSLVTHNFEQVFGMSVGAELNKAQRLEYKETRRNTVLLLTEVIVDEMQKPLQFRTITKAAETVTKKSESNTTLQGEDDEDDTETEIATETAAKRKSSKAKATVINVDWLREYAFEIVIDTLFVPLDVLHAAQTQPYVELPIWDPMGALLS